MEIPRFIFCRWKEARDRKSTRLNSSHLVISYAVFCLKKKKNTTTLHVTEQEVLRFDPGSHDLVQPTKQTEASGANDLVIDQTAQQYRLMCTTLHPNNL